MDRFGYGLGRSAVAMLMFMACAQEDSEGSEGGESDADDASLGGDTTADSDASSCVGEGCVGEHIGDGWYVDVLSTGKLWVDVWGSSPDDLWVIAQDATLARFDGSSWSQETLPADGLLQVIWGSAPDDVWVAGDLGEVLHFDGASWEDASLDTNEDRLEAFGRKAPASPVYAVSATATVFERRDQGWQPIASLGANLTRPHMYGCEDRLYVTADGDIFGQEASGWVRYGIGFGQDGIANAAVVGGEVWAAAGKVLQNDGTGWRWHTDHLVGQEIVLVGVLARRRLGVVRRGHALPF
jgi:hypothetical protein